MKKYIIKRKEIDRRKLLIDVYSSKDIPLDFIKNFIDFETKEEEIIISKFDYHVYGNFSALVDSNFDCDNYNFEKETESLERIKYILNNKDKKITYKTMNKSFSKIETIYLCSNINSEAFQSIDSLNKDEMIESNDERFTTSNEIINKQIDDGKYLAIEQARKTVLDSLPIDYRDYEYNFQAELENITSYKAQEFIFSTLYKNIPITGHFYSFDTSIFFDNYNQFRDKNNKNFEIKFITIFTLILAAILIMSNILVGIYDRNEIIGFLIVSFCLSIFLFFIGLSFSFSFFSNRINNQYWKYKISKKKINLINKYFIKHGQKILNKKEELEFD